MLTKYVLRRLGVFLLTVWIASTVNFMIPRVTLRAQGLIRPSESVVIWLAALEGESDAVRRSPALREFQQQFGFDQGFAVQYIRYLWSTVRFQFGYSLAFFPATVMDAIQIALPYTLGLMAIATAISFTVGVVGGGLFIWQGTPRAARLMVSLFMAMAPIPYYLMALVLLHVMAYSLRLFPFGGASGIGQMPSFDIEYLLSLAYHATLPALSIVLCSIGRWALNTRGVMATVLGDDYLLLAEAKGLKGRWVFLHYAMRNAMLPQFTDLATALGAIVSGAVLVEMIFAYPGMGRLLYRSIVNVDITLMQGIIYILVLVTATGTLAIDLIYPYLDPRIVYSR